MPGHGPLPINFFLTFCFLHLNALRIIPKTPQLGRLTLYLSEKQVVDLQAPYVQLQNSSSSSPLELFQMTETEIVWPNRSDWGCRTIKSATEVFTWIFWEKKTLTTKVHGLKPPKKTHESKKMQKRWKCRTQLHTPSESYEAKSNWYRRTLTHHHLGQHVGHVNVFIKSVCHLYYSSSFLLA